jgi:hypothetical protein
MRSLRINLATKTSFAVLIAALTLSIHAKGFGQKTAASPTSSPKPVNVTVVNTASQPVPVTGTVNIGNSNPIAVSGNVGIENAGSSPLRVRDVGNPARQPVRFTGEYTVPSGKRLVIEYFSADYETNSECLFLSFSLITPTDVLETFYLSTVGTDGTGHEVKAVRQLTRIYVNENSTVHFIEQSISCSYTLLRRHAIGYLVDLQ